MRITLSSVLLAVLLTPIIMTYRISPGDTPFWLFGLIFLGLALFVGIDIVNLPKRRYQLFKSALLWLLILASIGAAFISTIIVRHNVAPVFQVHDIILQLEAAIRFLLNGVNPYATTYFGTHLEAWNYSDTLVNPALYHFVMQPFYLLFSIPFYGLSIKTIGYFDARIPLYFLFFATLILAYRIPREFEKKLLFVIVLAFNPAMFLYTLEGRSDVFMFAFFLAGLFLLFKKRLSFSGVLFALAFAVKQSVWPFFPLYFAYLYFKSRSLVTTIKQLIPFTVTFAIVVGPFFLWNPPEFISSTVLYLSGSTQNSYPVSGYGFGILLNQMGFIKDITAYYPFIIWQAIFGIPVLIFLIRYLKKNNSVKALILSYGLFLFVFWYFSRYFNNSHLGYLTMIFIAAYFWPEDEGKKVIKKS